MKKWLLNSLLSSTLLGGTLLVGTSAAAQPQNDPPARPRQSGAIELRGVSSGSGGIVVTGGMAVPGSLTVMPAGGGTITITGSGVIAGPGVNGPVILGVGPQPVPQALPGYRAGIRRGPGLPPANNVPPGATLVRGASGQGPVWITSATATLAGKAEKTAYLGVVTTRVSATLRSQLKLKAGLVVEMVEPKTSAQTAGLQVHDVIEKCDDQWLINPAQFAGVIRMHKAGETVSLTVLRQGERKKIAARLDERETYAMDDDGDVFFARPEMNQANSRHISASAIAMPAGGFGGPVQQITGGALGAAPLIGGFTAAFGDDKQQLMIAIHDGHQVLTVKDSTGKEIFQGPIDTPEQRKLVPQDARKKLEEMDKIRVRIHGSLGIPGPSPETPPTR